MIIRIAVIVLLLSSALRLAHAIHHDKGYGEPYELSGKRLVLTQFLPMNLQRSIIS